MCLLWWYAKEHLAQLHNLKSVYIATTGPVVGYFGVDHPTMDEVFEKMSEIFSNWHFLEQFNTSRMVLTNKLPRLFGSLQYPLTNINLYAARLSKEDLSYLATSHHMGSLQQVELAYNDFRGMATELCDMLRNASSLTVLSLKMSEMQLHEKVQVMQALQSCPNLHKLAMYENEDMLSTAGYDTVIELACLLPWLKEFYIFPFQYKPFELFFRTTVYTSACRILDEQKRTDLKLLY